MNLDSILKEVFYDSEPARNLLQKHRLDLILENAISIIQEHLSPNNKDLNAFRDIASSILVSVNTTLGKIEDKNEKNHLELILSDVVEYLIESIASKSSNPVQFKSAIASALKVTSSINGYNYPALISLLKLNRNQAALDEPLGEKVYYYEWLGKERDLQILISDMKSNGWIYSTREFARLFTKHNDPTLQIPCNPNNTNSLLALFDVLKFKELIAPKGCRGHFHPLSAHLVDLEKNPLFKTDPKRVKNSAKRSTEKWEKHLNTAKSLTEKFQISKRP